MAKEDLPPGFWRAPNGSLRVLIRVKGFPPAVRTFKLHSDSLADRKRQRVAAELWAAETRRRLYAGQAGVDSAASAMTLADALELYARAGLVSRPANRRKDDLRIQAILKDPIARRRVSSLSLPDLAAYRDLLIHRDYERRIRRAIKAAGNAPDTRERRERLRSLLQLRQDAFRAGGEAAEPLRLEAARIEKEQGIGPVSRTTISNRMQLITRAMKFASQTTHGVPQITGLAMPPSSPGRTRRPSAQELERLLAEASWEHPLLPFMIRLAVATGLRRERLLELRTGLLQSLPDGRRAIAFPPGAGRRKRTGIVPVTSEIEHIITEAASLLGVSGPLAQLIEADLALFPVSGNVLAHAWRRLLGRCGIEDLRFHDLRHEATSRLFERGLTAAEVMSVTGHSTSEMVDRYAHYSSVLVLDRLEGAARQTGPPQQPASINPVAAKSPEAAALIEDISRLLERLAALHGAGSHSD